MALATLPLEEFQMERTNFENLQIYKLAETLSDQLWKIVFRWDVLARDTVGNNWYERATASAPTLQKEVAEEPIQSFVVF